MYVDLIQKQEERQVDISPEICVSGGALCSPHLFEKMLQVLKVKKVKVLVFFCFKLILNHSFPVSLRTD